jgi:tetratricopeptide (TPR) repeat protein
MLYNLGRQFQTIGKLDESVTCYTKALRLKPEHASAHNNLGAVLKVQGKINEAVSHFREAIRIEPRHVNAHSNLANILSKQGKFDQAIEHYRMALQTDPNRIRTLNNLAHILATHPDPQLRNPDQAIKLAERAANLTRHHSPTILNTLAAAYAAAGQFSEAIETAEKALDLAQSSGQSQLAEDIRNRLLLFKAGQPYIENDKQ